MVHVVQGYPGRVRRSRGLTTPPVGIVEGIPDYVRWFLYEPETGGALLNTQVRRTARHDASYRVSANFIDWVIRTHASDEQFLQKLNAAAREGRYSTDTWKELTGLSEPELAKHGEMKSSFQSVNASCGKDGSSTHHDIRNAKSF